MTKDTWAPEPACCLRLTGTTRPRYEPDGSPETVALPERTVTCFCSGPCTVTWYRRPSPAPGQLSVTAPARGWARTRVTAGTGGQPSWYFHSSNHCRGSRGTIRG